MEDKTQNSQENSEKERKENFTQELEKLRNKYQLDLLPSLDFYEYKVLPEEVQLALLVLNKHKARYIFSLVELQQNDN